MKVKSITELFIFGSYSFFRKSILKMIMPSIVLVGILLSCTNPFAPALSDNISESYVLGDQSTIDGFFKNFRYAYIFKDTSVYGNLLNDDFTFIYKNYDEMGVDKSWGREEDMLTTYRLFQAASNLDLIWYDSGIEIGDSLLLDVSRSFALTIQFNPTDIISIQGKANIRLHRQHQEDDWKMLSWRDVSNY